MEQDINKGTDEMSNLHKLYPEHDRVKVEETQQTWKYMLQSISTDISHLWNREKQLIQTEVKEKLAEAKSGIAVFSVGIALCFLGLIALVSTGIYVLDLFMPLWLAAAVMTVGLFFVGAVLIGMAKRRLEFKKLRPRHSIESITEIKTSLKERVNEFKH